MKAPQENMNSVRHVPGTASPFLLLEFKVCGDVGLRKEAGSGREIGLAKEPCTNDRKSVDHFKQQCDMV